MKEFKTVVKMIKKSNTNCTEQNVVTWFLAVFVDGVTAVTDVEESEEKKETSMMELPELVLVCTDLASSGCVIYEYIITNTKKFPR